jgi:hypothetical protein
MPKYSTSAKEYEVRSYMLSQMEEHLSLVSSNVSEEARTQLHQKYSLKKTESKAPGYRK